MADPRQSAFVRARNASLRELKTLEAEAVADALALLRRTQEEIVGRLAAAEGFEAWRLARLQAGIRASLDELGGALGADAGGRAAEAWEAGMAAIDEPIAAGGIDLSALFDRPDPRQLVAMRSFMTERLKNASAEVAKRIDGQLGRVLVGLDTPSQAIDAVAAALEGGRGRALTIVRTELGRAFSTASQERKLQAAQVLPGLRKQWRRSGKLHSRVTHDVADGQIKAVDQPFLVGGEKLMYPRDPEASARNTVNCGCVSLPQMDSWEVSQPGRQPLAAEELARSASKRRIAEIQTSQLARWANALERGRSKPSGSWQGLGTMPQPVVSALEARGAAPVSREISITDRRLLHMLRESKRRRKAALPAREVRRMAEHVERPKAVLVDRKAKRPTLVYVFEVPGESRLGKLVVRPRETVRRERPRTHNRVVTGGLDDKANLERPQRYDLVFGQL